MVAEFNVRKHVLAEIKPKLPKNWKLVAYGTNLDAISQTTVMLLLESITRFKEAPQGSRLVNYTLEIIEPKTDPAKREDSLDDNLIDLLNAIDDIEDLAWTEAKRGIVNGGANLGYDIAMTIRIDKD